jgi:hypothetical protein
LNAKQGIDGSGEDEGQAEDDAIELSPVEKNLNHDGVDSNL